MADQATEELRERVRSRYAGAARAVLEPGGGQGGCCEPAGRSCCGPDPAADAVGGFTDPTVRFTHEAAPGMHSAIIRAVKPTTA
jgi:hypothetical protein